MLMVVVHPRIRAIHPLSCHPNGVAATTFVVIIKCPAFKFRRLLLFFFPDPRVVARAVRRRWITNCGARGENEGVARPRWRLIPSIPGREERGYGRTISLKEH